MYFICTYIYIYIYISIPGVPGAPWGVQGERFQVGGGRPDQGVFDVWRSKPKLPCRRERISPIAERHAPAIE